MISSLFIDHFLSQSTKSLLIEVRHVTTNIIEKIVVHDLRLLETINFDKSMKIDTHKYSWNHCILMWLPYYYTKLTEEGIETLIGVRKKWCGTSWSILWTNILFCWCVTVPVHRNVSFLSGPTGVDEGTAQQGRGSVV